MNNSTVFAMGAIVGMVFLELMRRLNRKIMRDLAVLTNKPVETAAEEQQRKQDERVKETWRSGSREDRKNLEVQELERMIHIERRSR